MPWDTCYFGLEAGIADLCISDSDGVTAREEIAARKLDIPTLVLWADSDGALGPQLLRGLPDYVSDVSIHTLKKCSHWIQQDR